MKASRGSLRPGTRPGTWRCEYYIDGVRQPNITVEAKGKKLAWDAVDVVKAERAAAANAAPPADVWTVHRLADAWLSDHLPGVKAQHSRDLYDFGVYRYLLPYLGDKDITLLSTQDVQGWKATLLAGYAESTVVKAMSLLRQMLQWARDQEPIPLVVRNVAGKVKKPTIPQTPVDDFSLEEALAMIEVSRPPAKCVLALGMLGLRRGEVIGLHRSDIDLKEGVIHAVRQMQYFAIKGRPDPERRGWQESAPKWDGAGDVAIPAELTPIIKEQLEWSVGRRNQTDLLFINPRGGDTPMSGELPARYVAAACKAAGIDRKGRAFHSLRHTFVERARDMNIPDRDIAHMGRWKSTRQIEERYGNHRNRSAPRQIASAFDGAIQQLRENHAQLHAQNEKEA